jgi:hypothetical protein
VWDGGCGCCGGVCGFVVVGLAGLVRLRRPCKERERKGWGKKIVNIFYEGLGGGDTTIVFVEW